MRVPSVTPEPFLEFADLYGEGRLTDAADLSGAAKMLMLGDRQQVAQVAEVHLRDIHSVSNSVVIAIAYRTH